MCPEGSQTVVGLVVIRVLVPPLPEGPFGAFEVPHRGISARRRRLLVRPRLAPSLDEPPLVFVVLDDQFFSDHQVGDVEAPLPRFLVDVQAGLHVLDGFLERDQEVVVEFWQPARSCCRTSARSGPSGS